MPNMAEQFCDAHGMDDGLRWTTESGRNWGEVLDETADAQEVTRYTTSERNDGAPGSVDGAYLFEDGSLVVFYGDAWDVVGLDGKDGSGEYVYTVRF